MLAALNIDSTKNQSPYILLRTSPRWITERADFLHAFFYYYILKFNNI